MIIFNGDDFQSFAKPTCLSKTSMHSSELRFQPMVGDIVLLKHSTEGILSGRIKSISGEFSTIEVHANHGLCTIALSSTKIAAIVLGD